MENIYLCGDNGCTGESFRSWDEVYNWVREQTGDRMTAKERLNVKRGHHFMVGSRWYNCIVSEESMVEVA
jgi:hypothetical protein